METIRFIFDRFLKDEKELLKKRNWGNENRIASSLVNAYGEEFWPFVSLGFRLNSLAWFKTKDGKKVLEEAKRKYLAVQVTEKRVDKNDVVVYTRLTTTTKKSFRDKFIE